MLSFLIWFPIIAAIVLMLLPLRNGGLLRLLSLGVMMVVLVPALRLFRDTATDPGAWIHDWNQIWVPSLGIHYHVAVNRVSALLILLTALVGTAAIGISHIERLPRYFYGLGLLMIGGMIGAFASLDLLFFYIFHEFALIPTFLLIGIWGGEHRRRAAMKITVYLGLGSLVLLVGIIALYFAAGIQSFDLIEIKQHLVSNPLSTSVQSIVFLLLFFGFGTLISLFPFHTWAPVGYAEAPPLAAMLHAGVIKKFGLYGLFIIAIPLLPEGAEKWTSMVLWLALGNLVYCGYVAMKQTDLRYMLAYASVSHMGYAFLALMNPNDVAQQGFVLFLFAHGLAAAAAFGIAGLCREKTGTSLLSSMGGLGKTMPFLATAFTIAAFAACGLPGLANFPAELMIFLGSFQDHPEMTLAALWTVVITSVYFLRAIRQIFLGPLPDTLTQTRDPDLVRRMAIILLLLVLLMSGFFPQHLLGNISTSEWMPH